MIGRFLVIAGAIVGGMADAAGWAFADDVGPARWLIASIQSFASDVGSLVPDTFAGYARVFHPAYRDDGGGPHRVSWAEIARANGRVAHPLMQFHRLIHFPTRYSPGYPTSQPGVFDQAPAVGELPGEVAAVLARVLARHTATARHCWFAVWDGFDGLDGGFRGRPTFELPDRAYYLAQGPCDAATQSAGGNRRYISWNLWWPDDHAWCVASEIDLDSTYIGASETCIGELLTHHGLEAARISSTAGITAFSDPLNPTSGPLL